MAKKTGWDALPKKYRTPDPKTNLEPSIPKRVLVRCDLWDEVVEFTLQAGYNDDELRECFEEFGCKEAEIEGYLDQLYADDGALAMAANA